MKLACDFRCEDRCLRILYHTLAAPLQSETTQYFAELRQELLDQALAEEVMNSQGEITQVNLTPLGQRRLVMLRLSGKIS